MTKYAWCMHHKSNPEDPTDIHAVVIRQWFNWGDLFVRSVCWRGAQHSSLYIVVLQNVPVNLLRAWWRLTHMGTRNNGTPTGTRRTNNVIMTSKRRIFYVMVTLFASCVRWDIIRSVDGVAHIYLFLTFRFATKWCVHTCQYTLDISGSPLKINRVPGNIQGNLTGMCVLWHNLVDMDIAHSPVMSLSKQATPHFGWLTCGGFTVTNTVTV